FRDGAWPEIILGAVMGAARRAEQEAHRQRLERGVLHAAEPAFGPAEPFVRTTTTTRASAREPQFTARAPAPAVAPATQTPTAQAKDRATSWTSARFGAVRPSALPSDVFGPYARSAAAELSAGAEDDADTENGSKMPANSNTAPPAEPERVEVILKRETATVTLPADDGAEGLISRIGRALKGIGEPSEKNSLTRLAAAPAASHGGAPHDVEVLESSEAVSTDVIADADDDGAVTMAGRLRPARERS
ncbi:MAG: hypothetical protein AB7S70_06520, partial [Hyphomicrobium sp.]